jgi:hypothetical protein
MLLPAVSFAQSLHPRDKAVLDYYYNFKTNEVIDGSYITNNTLTGDHMVADTLTGREISPAYSNGIVAGVTGILDSIAFDGLTVREEDGTPNVGSVSEVRVSNGTLSDNGSGSVSITTGAGGITNLNAISANHSPTNYTELDITGFGHLVGIDAGFGSVRTAITGESNRVDLLESGQLDISNRVVAIEAATNSLDSRATTLESVTNLFILTNETRVINFTNATAFMFPTNSGTAGQVPKYDPTSTNWYFADDSGSGAVLDGYIKHCWVNYHSTTSIVVSPGEGYCNGSYFAIESSVITNVAATLTPAHDFLYIYVDDDGSSYPTPVIIDSTNEPTESATLHGWYNGNDRCIGVVEMTNSIIGVFTNHHGVVLSTEVTLASAMNPDGTWQTPDDAEGAAYFPVIADYGLLYGKTLDADSRCSFGCTAVESSGIANWWGSGFYTYQHIEWQGGFRIELGASRNLRVRASNDDDNGSLYLYKEGWIEGNR